MEKFDHYEINITQGGKHFFATAPRSCANRTDLIKVMNVLKEKFPSKEGYEITVTYWQPRGTLVNMDAVNTYFDAFVTAIDTPTE